MANNWKRVVLDGRGVWRVISRGHVLYACAHDVHKNSYDWWITSDRDGKVITARGSLASLALAQAAAIAESRKLAQGALSTSAFLPSDLHAIKTGIGGNVGETQNGRSDLDQKKTGPARSRGRRPKGT